MATERYTKAVLTLIAVALWLLVLVQVQVFVAEAEAQTTGPVDVNIAEIGGQKQNNRVLNIDGDDIPVRTIMLTCSGSVMRGFLDATCTGS